MAKYRIKNDLTIKAGTVFGDALGWIAVCAQGDIEASIPLNNDCCGLIVFYRPDASEWFEEINEGGE